MNLFVTGATGFIGSHFVQKARSVGHSVRALKRPNSEPKPDLNHGIHWVTGDISMDLSEWLTGIDCFVHLAAHSANHPYDTLSSCIFWNVFSTVRLFETAAACGIRHFIVTGTCFEYGLSALDYEAIPPNAPLRPVWSYPISKALATAALIHFAREKSVKMEILRLFQVFGEGELPTRFWPSLKKAALAGEDFKMTQGTQIRDFTPVETVVHEILQSLKSPPHSPGTTTIRNVGTGKPKSLAAFASECWETWGAPGKLLLGALEQKPGEISRLVPDLSSVYHAS